MKKNFTIMLFIITSILCLSGCGHEHTWSDATCTTPKICSECGETEGDILEHSWLDATCSTPKHCDVCDATEGEALAHTWTDASYQAPKTCSVCDVSEGEPLTPAFEEHGLSINAELDHTYDYVTICYDNPSIETVGRITFSDYQIIQEDESLGLENRDGYEWRTVHTTLTFYDENAWYYGYQTKRCIENYYDIEGWDNSAQQDEARTYYTVNYNGTNYDCIYTTASSTTGWQEDQTATIEYDSFFSVPIGYDGAVVGYYNARTSWEDGMYIYDIADENTIFFRMK